MALDNNEDKSGYAPANKPSDTSSPSEQSDRIINLPRGAKEELEKHLKDMLSSLPADKSDYLKLKRAVNEQAKAIFGAVHPPYLSDFSGSSRFLEEEKSFESTNKLAGLAQSM